MATSKIYQLLLLCLVVLGCQFNPDKFSSDSTYQTSQNETANDEIIQNDTDSVIEADDSENPIQPNDGLTPTESTQTVYPTNLPADSADELKSDTQEIDSDTIHLDDEDLSTADNQTQQSKNQSNTSETESLCDFESRAVLDVLSDEDREALVESTLKTEQQLLHLTDSGEASSKIPGFRVIFTKPGSAVALTRIYSKATVTDDVIDASVKQDSTGKWILSLKNISTSATIVSITFPAVIYDTAELGDPSDDILLEPMYLGGAYDFDSVKSYAWRLVSEANFAPLLMLMDSDSARIVWSANWPPVKYKLWWSYQHWMIEYPDLKIEPGNSTQYAIEDRIVKLDQENSIPAWMRAAFLYKSFLIQNMSRERIWPVSYPDWMIELPGSIAAQLQNDSYAGLGAMNIIKTWKDLLPLTLVWGQMSEYAGACCAFAAELHDNYIKPSTYADVSFLDFANDLSQNGYHVGYYSRPPGDLSTDTPMNDLTSSDKTLSESLSESGQKIDLNRSSWDWVQTWQTEACEDWHADSFYLDVLGMANQSFGDSLAVAKRLHDTAPQTLIIEGVRDIFPAVFLPDSALHAGKHFPGGEKYAFKNITTNRFAPFPELGTYILSDRLFLHGSVNSTWQIMGKSNQYWGERQIFLLGHKFNMTNPFDDWSDTTVANPVLLKAIEARNSVNFWSRSPRYFADFGLSKIPDDIQASRFIDKDGISLIAISNPLQLADQSLVVDGNTVNISSDIISIIEITSD